jgi:putative flippase GtrA
MAIAHRFSNLTPGGQFVRYLCVGVFNTVFGYMTFVIILTLLNAAMPARFLYLTVVLASILSTPLNITVAFLGYKFFVFHSKGNFLHEWLKCFAVYGTSMIPGLVALSALTRFLQSTIHTHATPLHNFLAAVEMHLTGKPLALLEQVANGKAMAGYIAGAVVIGVSTIYSFIGHKNITFRQKPAPTGQPG